MSNLTLPLMTYENLRSRVAAAEKGGPGSRQLERDGRIQIAYKTSIVPFPRVVTVIHHYTVVAAIGEHSFTLYSGGHSTKTTSERLTRILRDLQGEPRVDEPYYYTRIVKGSLELWSRTNGKARSERTFGQEMLHFSRALPNLPFVLHEAG